MTQLVVISGHQGSSLVVNGPLTAGLVHQVARVFTGPAKSQFAQQLRATFGTHAMRFYAVEHRGEHASVMFTTRANPDVLMYRRCPVRIADAHAAAFRLEFSSATAYFEHDLGDVQPDSTYLGAKP